MADTILVTHMPNVRYLTGFTGSSGCVIEGPRRKLFFTDFRYRDQANRQVRDHSVHIIEGSLLRGVCSFLQRRKIKLQELGFESAHLSHRDYLLVRRQLKGTSFFDASGSVEARRQIKSRREVCLVSEASKIADASLGKLGRTKLAGRSEREVAWKLETLMREAGSGPLPFDIIVASGPRSAMPHGIAGDRIIRENELVVIDFGASVDGYCCDMTRTVTTGKLSRRRELIYETVRAAQKLAIGAIEHGVACAEVDRVARDHIAAAGFGEAFGHSLGHGVGLEAHEAPVLSPKSADTLEAGMVVTVEPGIYTGRSGVRIEDTVLVTAEGARRLTSFTRSPLLV